MKEVIVLWDEFGNRINYFTDMSKAKPHGAKDSTKPKGRKPKNYATKKALTNWLKKNRGWSTEPPEKEKAKNDA